MASSAKDLTRRVVSWAAEQSEIRGLVLVGSHARGTARPDSDVDFVILVDRPATLLDDRSWTRVFGRVTHETTEDWGRLTSLAR